MTKWTTVGFVFGSLLHSKFTPQRQLCPRESLTVSSLIQLHLLPERRPMLRTMLPTIPGRMSTNNHPHRRCYGQAPAAKQKEGRNTIGVSITCVSTTPMPKSCLSLVLTFLYHFSSFSSLWRHLRFMSHLMYLKLCLHSAQWSHIHQFKCNCSKCFTHP